MHIQISLNILTLYMYIIKLILLIVLILLISEIYRIRYISLYISRIYAYLLRLYSIVKVNRFLYAYR